MTDPSPPRRPKLDRTRSGEHLAYPLGSLISIGPLAGAIDIAVVELPNEIVAGSRVSGTALLTSQLADPISAIGPTGILAGLRKAGGSFTVAGFSGLSGLAGLGVDLEPGGTQEMPLHVFATPYKGQEPLLEGIYEVVSTLDLRMSSRIGPRPISMNPTSFTLIGPTIRLSAEG